jgi:tRNA nucleotidyltransferase/poly(A) polymerase
MRDLYGVVKVVEEVLQGAEAYLVGGALRDHLLGRPVHDIDIATRDPRAAARAFARLAGGAPFALSERHGAWRVVLPDGRTVDFTPFDGSIEEDLATRDFTINAIAERVGGDDLIDPFNGAGDLAAGRLEAVSDQVFKADPLRLLRAVRLEDELPQPFEIQPKTERLIREDAQLVTRPAGERILGELERLSWDGFRRLEELGLLTPLGGSLVRLERVEWLDDSRFRLVTVLGESLTRYPISNELGRFARTLLEAQRPADGSARAVHRFRRATEPWALEALAFLGAPELYAVVLEARRDEPAEPLLRGDELDLPPGPEVGRLLAEIEEERAAGTIATKEEALDYARRNAGPVRQDG